MTDDTPKRVRVVKGKWDDIDGIEEIDAEVIDFPKPHRDWLDRAWEALKNHKGKVS